MNEYLMSEEKVEQNAERSIIYLRDIGCDKKTIVRVASKIIGKLLK